MLEKGSIQPGADTWKAPHTEPGSVELPEWAKNTGTTLEQIKKISNAIDTAGGWGAYVKEVGKKRNLSELERQINRDKQTEAATKENKPKFHEGQFVKVGERNFEIVDPAPDENGKIKAREMSWSGDNIVWTEKNVPEAELSETEAN